MSNATDLPTPEFDTLEPLPEMSMGPPPGVVGAAPPAYRAEAHGEYYRFLFAGILMTLGCLMPFGGTEQEAGYQQVLGAFYLVIGMGVIWSMWIAIYGGRFRMKWIMLSMLPFLLQLVAIIFVDRDAGVMAFKAAGKPMAESWAEMFSLAFGRTAEGTDKAMNFCRAFGTGRILLFFGSALNFWFLLGAIFGGAKQIKAQKAARMAEKAEKRGR